MKRPYCTHTCTQCGQPWTHRPNQGCALKREAICDACFYGGRRPYPRRGGALTTKGRRHDQT